MCIRDRVVVGLYNMMDSIFVGQLVGDVQMGAVSVSYPFTLINAGSAAMLGVGSASVLSRAVSYTHLELQLCICGIERPAAEMVQGKAFIPYGARHGPIAVSYTHLDAGLLQQSWHYPRSA